MVNPTNKKDLSTRPLVLVEKDIHGEESHR